MHGLQLHGKCTNKMARIKKGANKWNICFSFDVSDRHVMNSSKSCLRKYNKVLELSNALKY